jgi:hypothetical protein
MRGTTETFRQALRTRGAHIVFAESTSSIEAQVKRMISAEFGMPSTAEGRTSACRRSDKAAPGAP